MTVSELIEWLGTKPQGAKVMMHDADTEMFLEAMTGRLPYEGYSNEADPSHVPDNCVCLHCTYDPAL